MAATVTSPALDAPTGRRARGATSCSMCAGTGWADPWEVGDGTPVLTSCDPCLGVGLDDCLACDGDGAIALPVPCPCQDAVPA